MQDTNGKPLIIAEGTIYADGRVVWGSMQDDFDRCGIKILKYRLAERKIRLAYEFKSGRPFWFGPHYEAKIREAMQERLEQIRKELANEGIGRVEFEVSTRPVAL
jgi:hypothetical protein